MGFMNVYSNWRTEKKEKHRSKMESMDKCPDCNGRGYTPAYGFEYAVPFDCPGCDGDGTYVAWAENKE